VSPGDPRVAVVDIGSNSVRLFLCTGWEPGGPAGERLTTVTGLRRRAGGDGAIAPDALARLDACLAEYAERVRAFAPDRVAAVGTSAVRDAPNRGSVSEIVRARLGAELSVLSGDAEARLGFAGARLGAQGDGPIMVVDVGGGSTELARGDAEGLAGAVSLQLGGTRQTERHLRHDPPLLAEVRALREEAGALVAEGLATIGGPAPAVGVAGTITSLAAIDIGHYDPRLVHGHRLTRATVERITAELCGMPVARRAEVPGLDPARAPTITGASLIVCAVMEAARLDQMTVSERDLLDGLAMRCLAHP
jgi:exopolyphosphatase/guanosine-5'-triphosphate,3'-diphosphate pyrophosphatase